MELDSKKYFSAFKIEEQVNCSRSFAECAGPMSSVFTGSCTIQNIFFCSIASRRTQSSQIFSEGFKSLGLDVLSYFLYFLGIKSHSSALDTILSQITINIYNCLSLVRTTPGLPSPSTYNFQSSRSTREYFSIFVGQLIQRKNVESFWTLLTGV